MFSSFITQELLTLDPTESSPIVYLRGVSYPVLESLVQFVYSGATEVEAERLQDFLSLAQDMGVKGLAKERGAKVGEYSDVFDLVKIA